ncbi:unnamed protein product [Cylindrotheca closterium]|uniref:Sodium/calcium exchanger membrane region domain-containing protein n=1 Tax=Cylindrotheca closterium TaxID=2856 RepID=A0AAD2FJK5_9STRA|nr:unnamed protein product [Cylindrotheca closterium]
MSEEGEDSAPLSVWIGLSVISLVSFWCQATVTEERLVPALNVIADYYNIPDDIAGATLMAAGASSPELFSSLVALFITHSSLGLGTIVGSEIFNQLVICAGAVWASKTGELVLDRAIVMREVGFYALGIVLLYVALRDTDFVDGDDVEHIFISFPEACMVFGGYILYVIVCANMEAIVKLFGGAPAEGAESSSKGETNALVSGGGPDEYGSVERTVSQDIDVPADMRFVTEKQNLSAEPAKNWAAISLYLPAEKEVPIKTQEEASAGRDAAARLSRRTSSIPYQRSSILVDMFQHTEPPSKTHDLYEVRYNELSKELECFLWQRSYFYTKAYFGNHAWHLRWFTFSTDMISSVPDRQSAERHMMVYSRFNKIIVDENRLIIKITNSNPNRRNYTFMAPSKSIFDKIVHQLEIYLHEHINDEDDEEHDNFGDADNHVDLIEFPMDGSKLEMFFWIVLSPLRFAMHFTVPDVRQLNEAGDPMTSIRVAFLATFMCLVWLVMGSYAMVASLEKLAELLDIPDAVVGVTVSAAGTSLPNYVASKVAAQNGFGNQAVSNAFGSNTFNIMVGLGLPWVLYTSFGTGFQPYHGLRNEGILQSIIILAAVLLIFVLLMLQTGFVIRKWHGTLFIIMYIAYLALAIGQVYLS